VDPFTFTNLFAMVRASYTKHQIVRARTVDEQFRQTITPINTDGDWSLQGSLFFGKPVRPLGVNISVSNSASLGHSTEFVNATENATRTLRNTVSLRLANLNKDRFEGTIEGRFTFNENRYSLNRELDRAYLNRRFLVGLSYTPSDAWRFSSRLDVRLYSREVFGTGRDVAMWHVEINRSFLANNRAQIELAALNLLDQRVGVGFTNAAGFVREEQVESLGRYILLKFVYKIADAPNRRGGRRR
jgi:hypothetical protein